MVNSRPLERNRSSLAQASHCRLYLSYIFSNYHVLFAKLPALAA